MVSTLTTVFEVDRERQARWSATAALVIRAQHGDREALGQLIEQFQKTVYALCLGRLGNPSEAQELTQEVFLHVVKRLGQLREPERFAGWLRQVTVRMAINRATRRVATPAIDSEILEGVGEAEARNPLQDLIARERAERLWDGLGRLKPMDREALQAFYIQGRSLIEIAEELEVPIGTVKRRLHVARNRLKEVLEEGVSDAGEWADQYRDEAEYEEADAVLC